jgi:hypothetical protein
MKNGTQQPGARTQPIDRAPERVQTLAPIEKDCAYPLSVFQSFTGLDRAAMRGARHKGLKISKIGRRRFVIGADFIEFCKKMADQEA